MRELLMTMLRMVVALIALALTAVFVGALCGLGMWSCDVVRELLP